MIPKRCRSNPGNICVYGPCFFGGPCHRRQQAEREAISAGEAEYASWFPVVPHWTRPLSPGQQRALERQHRLVATLPQTPEQARMLRPCAALGKGAAPVRCGHCEQTVTPGDACAYVPGTFNEQPKDTK